MPQNQKKKKSNKASTYSTIGTVGGGVVGAYFGGPTGAMIGAAAGILPAYASMIVALIKKRRDRKAQMEYEATEPAWKQYAIPGRGTYNQWKRLGYSKN